MFQFPFSTQRSVIVTAVLWISSVPQELLKCIDTSRPLISLFSLTYAVEKAVRMNELQYVIL
jgi:hypothetical protein